MAFKEILQEMVDKCNGGLCSILMGYDGIPIDEYRAQELPFDLQLLSVEYASLLKEIKKTVSVLRTGNLEEVSFITGLSRVILRSVNDEFFVALILNAEGNLGKGRFLLQCAAPKLREELQ